LSSVAILVVAGGGGGGGSGNRTAGGGGATHPEEVTFELKIQRISLKDYKNNSGVISCRVWQLAI
jgi:hypothetical protein